MSKMTQNRPFWIVAFPAKCSTFHVWHSSDLNSAPPNWQESKIKLSILSKTWFIHVSIVPSLDYKLSSSFWQSETLSLKSKRSHWFCFDVCCCFNLTATNNGMLFQFLLRLFNHSIYFVHWTCTYTPKLSFIINDIPGSNYYTC